MIFDSYLGRGLLKRQKPDSRQIVKQLSRSKEDLITASGLAERNPDWAEIVAYHAALRAGRALLYSKGFLPADGFQHKTVVELTGRLLGPEAVLWAEKFERMRRKRNFFFYGDGSPDTLAEAKSAIQAAGKLVSLIETSMKR